MDEQRQVFIEGCTEVNNINPKLSGAIFDSITKFAAYGFNKSHSAAYALITYQTAYLKAHFPAEFTCATLSADREKIDRVVRTVG